MKIAIVGTRGIPNNYGGFETLAEYLAEYLYEDGIDITVYCSSRDLGNSLKTYKGAQLRYIPVSSHGFKGIIYDSLCLLNAIKKFDRILILGFGAGFVMPFVSKIKRGKIVLNFGGLDWKRDKWGAIAKMVIKKAEMLLVKYSGKVIADNIGIQSYIYNEYKKASTYIAYGGDQAKRILIDQQATFDYPFLLNPYSFIVTRIQKDNNIELILEAFSNQQKIPIVMVGNWDDSKYGKQIRKKYSDHQNLILLDAIYNREKLDLLRSNCLFYVHGHSAGGTNPSLTEAMFLGLPIFAFASGYNEYTTENRALFFKNITELCGLINVYDQINLFEIGNNLKKIAQEKYRWRLIASAYKKVLIG